jgi:hypothetical protein
MSRTRVRVSRQVFVGLLLAVLSLGLGWSGDQLVNGAAQVGRTEAVFAQTAAPKPVKPTGTPTPNSGKPPGATEIGTVDVVPASLQLGEQTYRQRCGTCHLAVPPQVLPLQSWQEMLPDSQHYGLQLNPLRNPDLSLVWGYIRTYARPLNPEEAAPYRVGRSRYFRLLHPDVKLPQPVVLGSCVTCHPGATKYNFRSLSAEWQTAP